MATALDVPIPHTRNVSISVLPGLMFQFVGSIPSDANRLTINLRLEGDQIAYHFDVRYWQGCVVRNAFLNNCWGPEELAGGLPLERGKPFELLILCQENRFLTAINGVHFCEFNHRAPLDHIKNVEIGGDVKVDMYREIPKMEIGAQPNFYGLVKAESGNNKVFVPGGLKKGTQVVISAVAKDSRGFSVNLRAGPDGDIAFHFNPRFNEGEVVRNNLANGAWHEEERNGGFPFEIGRPFTLCIRVKHHKYQVQVDGRKYCKFMARAFPLESFNLVEVNDAEVFNIQVF